MPMQPLRMMIRLFADGSPDERSYSEACLRHVLEAQARNGEEWISRFPNTPPILFAGVVYKEQRHPDGSPREDWQDIPTTLKRGNGDCKCLAPWWVAERRIAGDSGARCVMYYRLIENTYHYHIVGADGYGVIFDPSRALGMHQPPWWMRKEAATVLAPVQTIDAGRAPAAWQQRGY